MKKNLITLMTVTAILASSSAVFADTAIEDPTVDSLDYLQETEVQGDIMLISEEAAVPTITSTYFANTVTVTNITDGQIETNTGAETENEMESVINYNVNDDTLVYTAKGEKKSLKDVEKDANITVFANSYAPAPMIFPPQYTASVIIINDEETVGSVDVNTYNVVDETLVNVSNTLALNISDDTVVVDTDDKEVSADELDNKDLMVFYTVSTRSIPAQTTPEKVVVLGESSIPEITVDPEATAAPAETAAPVDYTDATSIKVNDVVVDNVYVKDDTLMVPLRAIAEGLGFTVEWNGDIQAVTLNGVYSLNIGENSYVKGKMVPITLSAAPEIKDDLTYVPVEYFSDVTESTLTVDGDSIVVAAATVETAEDTVPATELVPAETTEDTVPATELVPAEDAE